MVECPYCNAPIEAEINFCAECERQVRCLQCSKLLRRDKKICLVCGKPLLDSKTASAVNRYSYQEEYTENTGSRKIELSLTDNAVKEAAPLFGQQHLPPMRSGQASNGHTEQKAIPAIVVNANESFAMEKDVTVSEPVNPTGLPNIESKDKPIKEMFEVDNEGYLISHHPDYKGSNKKSQQKRFVMLYVAAYPECNPGAQPTQKHITAAARRNGLYDTNFPNYFGEVARQHLNGADGDYTLNPSGRMELKSIIEELIDGSKQGFAYWSQPVKLGTSRPRMTNDDRALIASWIEMASKCSSYDIRQRNKSHELAMFALFDITKELKVVEAVKSSVAYGYLTNRYKTVSAKPQAFGKALTRKSNSDKFQQTDSGLFFLTQQAEKTVLQWINGST